MKPPSGRDVKQLPSSGWQFAIIPMISVLNKAFHIMVVGYHKFKQQKLKLNPGDYYDSPPS
jgi:hypothetical protein